MMIRALWLKKLLWPGEIDGAEVSLKTWAGTGTANGHPLVGGLFRHRVEV